jgi:CubicO group peptidase (beta-lactamase class C family)
MLRLWSLALLLLCGCPPGKSPSDGGSTADSGPSPADAGNSDAGPVDISSHLVPLLAPNGLPALGAAASDGTHLLALGVAGVRKLGDPTPVTSSDAWHLGSDTKAMTATITAGFVEAQALSWNTTLPQAFPQWAATIDPGYQGVTLQMLLAHVGGAPPSIPADVWAVMQGSGSSQALRAQAVQMMLTRPPGADAGTFAYANAGYMMVGAALEQQSGQPWETLIQQRLFTPLGMSCGFGPMATPGQTDGIWGHAVEADGGLTPLDADNPPALGPAGTVHCPLADWVRFANEHLKGARGEPTTLGLSASSWTTLHTPWPIAGVTCDPTTQPCYALGWAVTTRSWANGLALQHLGSNTLNYADIWIAPGANRVYVSATNRGDGATCGSACPAFSGADSAIAKLLALFPGP